MCSLVAKTRLVLLIPSGQNQVANAGELIAGEHKNLCEEHLEKSAGSPKNSISDKDGFTQYLGHIFLWARLVAFPTKDLDMLEMVRLTLSMFDVRRSDDMWIAHGLAHV